MKAFEILVRCVPPCAALPRFRAALLQIGAALARIRAALPKTVPLYRKTVPLYLKTVPLYLKTVPLYLRSVPRYRQRVVYFSKTSRNRSALERFREHAVHFFRKHQGIEARWSSFEGARAS